MEKRWERCAVVSSSDALLQFSFGAEIDGYDAVFRINMSPTEGFEGFVGSRTDVAVTNWPSWNRGNGYMNGTELAEKQRPSVVVVQDPLVAADRVKCCYKRTAAHYRRQVTKAVEWCRRTVAPEICVPMHPAVPEHAWRLTCRAAAQFHARNNATTPLKCPFSPSSGLIATVFAADACSSVKAFGFGLAGHAGHYYATDRKIGFEIKPSLENAIFQAWHRSHLNFSIAERHGHDLPPNLPQVDTFLGSLGAAVFSPPTRRLLLLLRTRRRRLSSPLRCFGVLFSLAALLPAALLLLRRVVVLKKKKKVLACDDVYRR